MPVFRLSDPGSETFMGSRTHSPFPFPAVHLVERSSTPLRNRDAAP